MLDGLNGCKNFKIYWTAQTDAPNTINILVNVFLVQQQE